MKKHETKATKRHMQVDHPLFVPKKWTAYEIGLAIKCNDELYTGHIDCGSCFDVHIQGAYEQLKNYMGDTIAEDSTDDDWITSFSEPFRVDGYENLYYVLGTISSGGYAPYIKGFYIHTGEVPWKNAKEIETPAYYNY